MLNIAILGLGNLPRAFLRILQKRPLPFAARITGVATGSHGCIVSESGLTPEALLRGYEQSRSLSSLVGAIVVEDAFAVMARSNASVVLLCTPLNPQNAEPGLSYCRAALRNKQSVISVDKGPIAFAYDELSNLARENGVSLRYEGIVMDGMPVFSFVEKLLPGVVVKGFEGVLNATTGIAMQSLEEGRPFQEGILLAQQLGIAEADPSYDLEGYDAQMKTCALANILLGAKLNPKDVSRQGLIAPSREEVAARRESGEVLRMIAQAKRAEDGAVIASVAPRWVRSTTVLGATRGAASVIVLHTDLMGEIALYERDPQIEQSAYALYLDLILFSRPGG